jgi:DNA-binding SARP family transcriptional activator
MEIKILGPLEIGPPNRPPDLRRAKERSLLAILAINAGETLTSETLIRRAWDDDNPSGARVRTLHSYLSHIRDVVTDTDGGMSRLESNSSGYRLRLDRECVDLHRFRRLRDQARALTDSGEAEGRRLPAQAGGRTPGGDEEAART